jgi:hypothetical protein
MLLRFNAKEGNEIEGGGQPQTLPARAPRTIIPKRFGCQMAEAIWDFAAIWDFEFRIADFWSPWSKKMNICAITQSEFPNVFFSVDSRLSFDVEASMLGPGFF